MSPESNMKIKLIHTKGTITKIQYLSDIHQEIRSLNTVS